MPPTNKNHGALGYTCGTCGRKGHNTRGCTLRDTRIDKVGVEVEGYWTDLVAAKERASELGMGRGCRDGSLDAYGGAWEFQTTPGPLGLALDQVSQIYPDMYAADAGMHVHVSFKDAPITVGLFACEEFFDFWARRWRGWGERRGVASGSEFWRRLRGDNTYCRVPSMAMFYDRANIVDMDRYNQLNFGAWSEHKTIESRLLPLFRDSKLALDAITETVEIFDHWARHEGPALLASAAREVTATFSPATIRRIIGDAEVELLPRVDEVTVTEIETYAGDATPGMTRVPAVAVPRILGVTDALA